MCWNQSLKPYRFIILAPVLLTKQQRDICPHSLIGHNLSALGFFNHFKVFMKWLVQLLSPQQTCKVGSRPFPLHRWKKWDMATWDGRQRVIHCPDPCSSGSFCPPEEPTYTFLLTSAISTSHPSGNLSFSMRNPPKPTFSWGIIIYLQSSHY